MDLKECYAELGGDYHGVVARFHGEGLVKKFAFKFLGDGSYDLLCQSLEEKNYEEAFRAAHTLKGICQNLGFTRLYDSSSQLTEVLRFGWKEGAQELFEQVARDYQGTTGPLKSLRAGEDT